MKHDGAGAIGPSSFHPVDEAPVRQLAEALLGKWWAREVTTKRKPALSVPGSDGGVGMHDKGSRFGTQRWTFHGRPSKRFGRFNEANGALTVTGAERILTLDGGAVEAREQRLVILRTVVVVAVEGVGHACRHFRGDLSHLQRTGWLRGMELSVHEDAIEDQGVQVYIEAEGRVEPLHEGDGTDLGVGDGAEAKGLLGAAL